MQRSRRGYKQKPSRRDRPKYVHVKRWQKQQMEIGHALMNADDNMTPEQMESWREKIKRDK